MFRKTILAIAAVSALGVTALAPTSASAWHGGWHGHHHHRHFHFRHWAPRIVVAPTTYYGGCYLVKRWVDTPWGPRLRRVQVCG